jgi:hypothetical protein
VKKCARVEIQKNILWIQLDKNRYTTDRKTEKWSSESGYTGVIYMVVLMGVINLPQKRKIVSGFQNARV